MSDQVYVRIKEGPGEKPKGFWKNIAGWFRKNIPGLSDYGRDYIGGIATEKTTKNRAIEDGILGRKEALELENVKERNRHEERMKELQDDGKLKSAQALKAQAEAIVKLLEAKRMGVEPVGISLPMIIQNEDIATGLPKEVTENIITKVFDDFIAMPEDEDARYDKVSEGIGIVLEEPKDEDTQDDEMAEEVEVD